MKGDQTTHTHLPVGLVDQIQNCGFFPQLVTDSVMMCLGKEPIDAFLVHHEATFASQNIGRHLSVLVLTPTRLVVCHTDEHSDGDHPQSAVTSTESVPLRLLGTVSLTRTVEHPEAYGSSDAQVVETWLSLNWRSAHRVDVEPARCPDPTCEVDHGYLGSIVAEDMVIRMSPAADGAENVDRLVAFATAIQQKVR